MLEITPKVYHLDLIDATRMKHDSYRTKYEFTGDEILEIKAKVNDLSVDCITVDIEGDVFDINTKNLRNCLVYKSLSKNNPPNELVSILPLYPYEDKFILNYKMKTSC